MGLARRPAGTPTADSYKKTQSEESSSSDLEPEDDKQTPERSSSPVKRGWAAATAKITSTSNDNFADDWSPPEGSTLGKFLEDEPFASVGQHWVDEIYRLNKGLKCSFNCPEGTCPMCGVGHKPRALVYFNFVPLVINEEIQENPQVVALKAGPLLTKLIQKEAEGKGGPLSRHYWELKKWTEKNGKREQVKYGLSVVKSVLLADDWELAPEDVVEALKDLELYDESIIPVADDDTLREVTKEYLSSD